MQFMPKKLKIEKGHLLDNSLSKATDYGKKYMFDIQETCIFSDVKNTPRHLFGNPLLVIDSLGSKNRLVI